MNKIFNKGLDKDDQKEGLFKRLKSIGDKNEDQEKTQLDAIKNINIGSKLLKTIGFFSAISEEAKKLIVDIKQIDDWLDTAQLLCTKTDRKTKYDFNNFTFPSKFTLKIYHHDLMLQEVEDDQVNLEILINKLNNNYNPKNIEKVKGKEDTFKSAKKLLTIREDIIGAFEKGAFPYIDGFQIEEEINEESTVQREN